MATSLHLVPSSRPSPRPPASLRAAWTVLAVALAARLLVLLSLVTHSSTTWIYQRGLETGFVAHALLSHQGFASPFGGHTGPTALISPGYVLLVAAVFRLFGEYSTGSAIVILLAQILLGVLTVWVVMCLAARLAGARAALLAGAFFAIWPTFLWVPTIFWDSALTLCLLPTMLLAALRLRDEPSRGLWTSFGALCGLTVLINLALCVIVGALFCWCAWNVRGRTRDMVFAALLAGLIYAPWPLRNAHTLHAFIPLRTTVGLELWMGNRAGAAGFLDESVFPLYNKTELASYLQRGEVAYMRDKSAAAQAAIQQHPGTFAMLTAKRVCRFWFGTGTHGGSAFYAVGATLTTVLGLAGVFTLVSRGKRGDAGTVALFVLPLLLFPLPYYITHAEFRYRLALDPILAALAAHFVAGLVSRRRRQLSSLQLPPVESHPTEPTRKQAAVHA